MTVAVALSYICGILNFVGWSVIPDSRCECCYSGCRLPTVAVDRNSRDSTEAVTVLS